MAVPISNVDRIDEKELGTKIDVADVHYEPSTAEEANLGEEIDHAYLNASRTTRFYRGTLFQMILFGA